ncbi:MAG: hypothetical protein M1352_01840 [Patescibacteria group bacterium]|nr:hypothetical protein [Patescibacteria group bacterium]
MKSKLWLPLFILFFALAGVVLFGGRVKRSLAQTEGSAQKSEETAAESPESPEPKDTPEQEKQSEQETEKIQKDVQKEIESRSVNKVEVQPTSSASAEGKIKLEKTDGSSSEKTVPASNASLINVQNSQAGNISVSVSRSGAVTLVNGGITIQTNYPVVVDPKSQTIAIRTPGGVTVINTLPAQALKGLPAADKPTAVQSAVLGEQNGQAYYDVKGPQLRKFLGIIPVSAPVETRINAMTGSAISIVKPWYLNIFGFLYTT